MSKKEAMQKWLDKRKLAGFCPHCGKSKPAPDRALCASCLKKARGRRKRMWAARQSQGLCPAYGSSRSDDHFIICAECRARHHKSVDKTVPISKRRRYMRKWKRKHKRELVLEGRGAEIG